MNQKRFANIVLIVLVVVLAGALGYVALVKKLASTEQPQNNLQDIQQNLPPASNNTVVPPNQNPTPPRETASWKTYRNEKYGFEFKYPMSAKLITPPGNTTILSHTEIEFEKESSFYNRASIAFFVYPKGAFQHYPQSDKCKIYQRSTKTIDGKTASIVEQSDCPRNEGSPTGGSGHTLTAIISLLSTEDLVYTANLNNSFISQNNFGTKILDTLSF